MQTNKIIKSSLKKTIDIIIPVKNGGNELTLHIDKWLEQATPSGWLISVYIVDDGSTDASVTRVKSLHLNNSKIHILHNEKSQGRSEAINKGVNAGSGQYLAIFDADCYPSSKETIKAFTKKIEETHSKLFFGSLKASSGDLWGRYFQEVVDRRKRLFFSGDKAAFTTANCVIERQLFCDAGKYSSSYTKYGFEDKDLIIRLLALDSTAHYVEEAEVIHNDNLSLNAICEKMLIAGQYSSLIFQKQHPDIYRKMLFYKVDMRHKPKVFMPIVASLRTLKKPILLLANRLLELPLPYNFKAKTIKYCSGLFYAIGTSETVN